MELLYKITGVAEGSRLDWLHPSKGPFPDFAGHYRDEDGFEYITAVWRTNESWVAVVEGPELEGPPAWSQGIMMSYRWWPRDDEWSQLYCRPTNASVFDVDVVEEDRNDESVLRVVATASIHLYLNVTR